MKYASIRAIQRSMGRHSVMADRAVRTASSPPEHSPCPEHRAQWKAKRQMAYREVNWD